jgi:predicted secreted acid phosphatase
MSLRTKTAVISGILCFGCLTMTASDKFVHAHSQPNNVGDAKIAALAYHDKGVYENDLSVVVAQASRWIATHAKKQPKAAVVFDIDETALSNWEVIKLDDFGRPIPGPCDPQVDAPCGWAAWDQLGRDPAIQPTLKLFQEARQLGFAIFFITGRPESQRTATERNLTQAGYSGYTKLYMTPDGKHFNSAADFKAPIRAEIEKGGYTIVANVGDQPSDLQGGHAQKSFLLPDPFYRVP